MGIIDNLVGNIETRWAMRGFRESAFPEIAAQALAEANLTEQSAQRQIFDHIMESPSPVRNHIAREVATLYDSSRFAIYLHLWKDGGIALHHHEWAGAYQVLVGSSIAATYSFHPRQTLRRGLVVGDLAQRSLRLMEPGAGDMIEPGPSFIHGLSYISKTAFSISVRTRRLYDTTSMWYLRPALGVRNWTDASVPESLTEQTRLLSFLHAADPPQHRERLLRMAGHEDLFVSLAALRHAQTTQVADEVLDAMRDAGWRTHGPDFDILFDASKDLRCVEYIREQKLKEPQENIQLRTLLSLLYVCHDRDALLRATADLVDTDDPVQWIATNTVHLLERASGPEPTAGLKGLGEILKHLVAGVPAESLVTELASDYELDANGRQRVLEIALELLKNPALRVFRTESTGLLTLPRKEMTA